MKWFAFIAYTVLIAYVSLAPSGDGGIALWDKAMHAITYAIYAVLGVWLCRTRIQIVWVLSYVFLFGIAMEFGQSFVRGRDMSFIDQVANAMGLTIGGWLAARLHEPALRAAAAAVVTGDSAQTK